MDRYTRIICTLGPASSDEAMVHKMASRGMNVARINCSHGSQAQHQMMVDLVRHINKKNGHDVSILLDLPGYRIRIGKLKKRVLLVPNKTVYISSDPEHTEDNIPFDYDGDLKLIEKGFNVFIDDGLIYLRVTGHSGKRLKLKVVQGGVLKERKGVNIPLLKLQSNIMTERDQVAIEFGIKNKVEKIAQSFVRNKKDIQRVIDLVKPVLPECTIIAKIENYEGLKNIEGIVNACEGIMVARGDLGVSIPIYKIPVVQKYLIRHCNRKKKLSITATQMLDSMIENGRPTRAEVSDVANAIMDGTDYVMLSGETAVGKYPSRSIKMMSMIVSYTEKNENVVPK